MLGIGLLVLLSALAYVFISRKLAASERKRLKEINQLKNTLFTNITHEFRTPLTVIKGMADSMKSNIKNKDIKNLETSLEMIERNSDNLLHLVNEMLDLSKIESGNMDLQLVQSDVIPFLKYISESFNSYAEENGISLTVYSEIDSLIMGFDSNKLTSIVSNILSNAVKFTPEHGKIIVHINEITRKDQHALFIKIKDNGIGISKNDLPNVFNRFYQTDASTIRKHEGTGIGLALTKELVELMNGNINVKSTLEKGSEFSVTIPITRKASLSPKVQIEDVSNFPTLKTSVNQTIQLLDTNSELPLVLIIEDNIDVAHYLKTCLTDKYQTIHAVNGIEGIEMALENIPDIIICDVMMPGKDGFEVCATLKTDERSDHIPIIILTAKVTTEDRITGLSHGADAYLAKPFNKEELFTRLDQLVAIRQKLIHKIKNDGFKTILKNQTQDPKLQFLQKAINLIQTEINNSNFRSAELAKKLVISESQLYRKIKAITEKSTAVFIRSIRLQYAKELLTTTDKTVSEVAYEVGFNDPSWFSRAFKDEFGFPPSDTSK
ncbi:ATP-binding protein [Winogradskyella psychrotolerans]|nr:ATP-binding protein [Winogradskyella psychrotolerans]